jgi:hypothetical protein
MNNFASIFEELSKLYEEATQEAVVENFENENGVAAWSKNAISWYTQAAKELGLSDYTMKLVGYGNNAKVVVTAVKNGKKLSAEELNEAVTHEVQNVEDAKEFIKYIFPDLTESITEAAEDEIVEDEIPVEEVPVEEPAVEEEPRRLIIECDKCGALVIKDEADIVVDEETDLVNVEEECQFCEEAKGYKIIGVVAPYEAAEAEEPIEDELAEEDDVIDEGLSEGADIKDPNVSKILARLKKIADANGTKIGVDNMSSQTELIKKHCSEKECDLLRNVVLTDGTVVNMLEEDLAD